jgi:hypothetical protein
LCNLPEIEASIKKEAVFSGVRPKNKNPSLVKTKEGLINR